MHSVEDTDNTGCRAVILAAGLGSRLRPLTETVPKPLTPVNGVPIIAHTLSALASVGLTRATIVIGHLGSEIRRVIGPRWDTLTIDYVMSADYGTTNSAHSLYLALESIGSDVLVLDGDVLFERKVLTRLLDTRCHAAIAAAAFLPGMTGAAVTIEAGARVSGVSIIRDGRPDGNDLKTLSVQLFRSPFLVDRFLPALRSAVAAGETTLFHEEILSRIVTGTDSAIEVVRCDDCRWIEIDDHRDLEAARLLFAGPELKVLDGAVPSAADRAPDETGRRADPIEEGRWPR